ncbi:hypothetical protein [Sphingobacterium sp. LRF_L2]|uniref:hypothetical protein n=1 Tax=Sphingobacterium sp. LRF_L2 TaxID=3369421 RepID=UPI003F5FE4A9
MMAQPRFVRNETPNVASMLKHVDFPVNHYTGIPEIKLPLYNVKVDDFELQLNLNYLSTGLKVSEAASNVGLGWNIGSLGVISRVVKGIPDDYNRDGDISPTNDLPGDNVFEEKRYGLFWSNSADLIRNFNMADTSFSYVRDKILNISYDYLPCNWYLPYHDSHPDIFYFSVNGISGKFVFDSYENIQKIELIPYQDIKIIHQLDSKGKIASFTLTDADGHQYFFNDIEEITDYSHDLDNRDGEVLTYNSSWHLSKIVTNKNKVIDFSYEKELIDVSSRAPVEYVGGFGSASITSDYIISSYDYVSETWTNIRDQQVIYYDNFVKDITQVVGSYVSPNVRRLAQITTDNELIFFDATLTRQDLTSSNSKAITGFRVFNRTTPNVMVKGFEFKYDYFNSDILVNDHYQQYQSFYKRLKLTAVDELTNNGNKQLYAQFSYNEQFALPNRLSNAQDLWGFYNGATGNTSLIPTIFVYPSNNGSNRFRALPLFDYLAQDAFVLPGASRLPNEQYMLCGLLTKVKYSTGAETEYTYGMHDFRYPDPLEGGGARIERIDFYSKGKRELSRMYTYLKDDGITSSGSIITVPTFAFPSGTTDLRYAMRFSVPQGTLSGTQGSYVGYKAVQEIFTSSVDSNNNGKIVYYFDMPATAGETNDVSGLNLYKLPVVKSVYEPYKLDCASSNSLYIHFWDLATRHYQLSADSPPFPELPIYDWNRGQLLKQVVYDKHGNIISIIENKYQAYFKSGENKPKIVYGFVNKLLSLDADFFTVVIRSVMAGHVAYSRYEYLTGVAKVLSETKTTSRFSGRDVVEKVSYEYGSHYHMKKTKEFSTNSSNDTLLTEYRYAGDYSWGSFPAPPAYFTALSIGNRAGTLIESTKYKFKAGNKIVLQSSLNEYKLHNSVVVPAADYLLDGGENLSPAFKISSISEVPDTLIWDSRYKQTFGYNQFTSNYQLLEMLRNGQFLSSYLWGYNNQYPVATVENASQSDIAYTGFEAGEKGNWLYSGTVTGNTAHTGNKSYILTTPAILTKSGLNPSKTYKLNVFASGPAELVVQGGSLVSSSSSSENGWTHYSYVVKNASTVSLLNPTPATIYIDDVSLHPFDAPMSIYTFEPGIGVTSKIDPQGITEYYGYDSFGRLIVVKDHMGYILKTYCYNFAGDLIDCDGNSRVPANSTVFQLAYASELTGDTPLCQSSHRNTYYSTGSSGGGTIVLNLTIYQLGGEYAPAGYYSSGSGVIQVGANGKVVGLQNCNP